MQKYRSFSVSMECHRDWYLRIYGFIELRIQFDSQHHAIWVVGTCSHAYEFCSSAAACSGRIDIETSIVSVKHTFIYRWHFIRA